MLEAAQKAGVQRFVYTSTELILKSYRAPKQSARALIDETVVLTLGRHARALLPLQVPGGSRRRARRPPAGCRW